MRLTLTHPALAEARTIHTKFVKDPSQGKVVKLVRNKKFGGKVVTKGKLKGFPIFTVTLEERKTCPSSCLHWDDCYGNGMLFAHRFKHGKKLELQIKKEIDILAKKHPKGFLVRLHILGDFYSPEYVGVWTSLMLKHKNLHVFGFTARSPQDKEIWRGLVNLRNTFGDRWMVRYSGAPMEGYDLFAPGEDLKINEAITCLQQTGVSKGCASCSLCWETSKHIQFITH